jgi:hypothetical protein
MAETLDSILFKHQSYLQRVATHTGNKQIEIIDSLNGQLRVDLVEWLDNNDEYRLTVKQQQQVEVLTNKIKATRGKAIEQATGVLESDMFELAEAEHAWMGNGLETLGAPKIATSSANALQKMVTRTPFDGSTIQQYYKRLSDDDSLRIINTIQRGLSDGLTLPQITNSVFGTKRLNYTDGVLQTARNSVMNTTNNTNSGIVRTVVNGVNNESKMMLYKANSDIMDKVDYAITFDGRTSDTCVANSVKGINGTSVYKIGTEPSLPAHRNCRTYYVPVVDGFEDLRSTKPAVTDPNPRTRDEREKDFRAEARDRGVKIGTVRKEWSNKYVKQVPDNLTFPKLLENDDKFARGWLGKTRYDLWKKGDIKIDRFVDVKGETLTIEQLFKKDPDAFKRAGVKKPN